MKHTAVLLLLKGGVGLGLGLLLLLRRRGRRIVATAALVALLAAAGRCCRHKERVARQEGLNVRVTA